MALPKVYADFQNADAQGRLRLNCIGTIKDLARLPLELREGLRLTLYAEDADQVGQPCELQAEGVVTFSKEESIWVARIDWNAIQRVPQQSGVSPSSAPASLSSADTGWASPNR